MAKLIKYIFLFSLLFLFTSFSACNKKSDVTKVIFQFKGFKKDFYQKYTFLYEISDRRRIEKISDSINQSTILGLCPSHKPVMWEIYAYVKYKSGSQDYLFSIFANTKGKISLWKGSTCYENESLINKVTEIMKIEEIKSFNGRMTQSDFDLLYR